MKSLLFAPLLVAGSLFVTASASPPGKATTPDVVDLRRDHTPICQQGGRDSCTYFPPVAALEAAYRRKGHNVSLSVEHLIWIRDVTAGGDNPKIKDASVNENHFCVLTGGGLHTNFQLLSKYGLCRSEDMPYIPDHENPKGKWFEGFEAVHYKWWEPFRQFPLNQFNFDPALYPGAARRNARYGAKEYVFLTGKDCQDHRKIEEILASGHEVAVNWFIAFKRDPKDEGPGNIPPVVLFRAKNATMIPQNSHAVLIVGYDRPRQFFIVKNSWGPNNAGFDAGRLPEGWKDVAKYKGYTLFHYNYLLGNREAAYIKDIYDPKSTHFDHQRALGLWKVEMKQKSTGRVAASGVLAWRRLPNTADGKQVDLRVGDLYTVGKEYRVNAKLQGVNPTRITLYIDFDRPHTSYSDTRGTKFLGALRLPDDKAGTIAIDKVIAPKETAQLLGVPVNDLIMTAVQSLDKNLLKDMKAPR
jgi:hypothetical protein